MPAIQPVCEACGKALDATSGVCAECAGQSPQTANETFAFDTAGAGEPPTPESPEKVEATPTASADPEPQKGGATPTLDQPLNQTESAPSSPPRAEPKQDAAGEKLNPAPTTPGLFFVAPQEEERRYAGLTSPQIKAVIFSLGIAAFIGTIAFSLWRNHQREAARLAAIKQAALIQPTPPPTPPPPPLATPTPLPDDQTLTTNVRLALASYDVLAMATRYKFEVKDGAVTLFGDAESQAEKDGVENVVKGVSGVQSVANQMIIKSSAAIGKAIKLNEAEAKRLEEALRKELAERDQREEEARKLKAQQEAQQEAERLRREEAAAKLRDEQAAALRKQDEERLKKEAEEAERRQEAERRAEAERRTRAEQARAEASALRSGTVAWSGTVKGVEEIVIAGSSASVRHVSGDSVKEPKASFSAPVPRAPVSVKLLSSNGRAPIKIIQEPSAANGYTTIVRIGEGDKADGKRHEFTLKWSTQ